MARSSAVRRRLHVAIAAALALLAGGCSNLLRTSHTYDYRLLRQERKVAPLAEVRYAARIYRRGKRWRLGLRRLSLCERQTIRVEHEQQRVTVRAPTWYWFVAVGAAMVGTSAAFWTLAARSRGVERTGHILIGSLAFLAPGLALGSVGVYYRSREGVRRRDLGERRTVTKRQPFVCATKPARPATVELSTRTGSIALGRPDARGELALPSDRARPFVRRKKDRRQYAYFEVAIGDDVRLDVVLPADYPRETPAQNP